MASNTCAGGNVQRTHFYPGKGFLKLPKVLWKFKPGGHIGGPPIVADGTVFMGCEDKIFYAIDALTGEEKWSFKTGDKIYSAPAYENGIVFFSSRDSNFYALDAGTGKVVWQHEIERSTDCYPVALNGVVYFGAGENFYALDSRTGESKWVYKNRSAIDLDLPPVIWNRMVYIGNRSSGLIRALDIDTGKFAANWEREPDEIVGGDIQGSPAVSDGVLCLVIEDTTYLALDANSGEEKWRRNMEESGDEELHEPAIAEGTVYCHDKHRYEQSLFALDLQTGEEIWKITLGDVITTASVEAPPCVAGGLVYVFTGRWLCALDAKTGEWKWRTPGKNEYSDHAAVIADGIIYYYSRDDRCLKARKEKEKKQSWLGRLFGG